MGKSFKKVYAVTPDGWSDWQYPVHKGYKLGCCDCGLVHNVDFKVTRKRWVGVRVQRNPRATANVRRYKDVTDKGTTYLKYANRCLIALYADIPDKLPAYLNEFERQVRLVIKERKTRKKGA